MKSMQHIGRLVLISASFVFLIASCRSTKKIQTAMSKKDSLQLSNPLADSRADSITYMNNVYTAIQNNMVDFETFSAKIKVDFEGADGKKNDFNAALRIKKDSIIWISINAVLGIEAFRVMITPDSVKVLNKLDRLVQLRSVSYLQEVTRIPMTFYDLQNLLIGNPLFLDSNFLSYKRDETGISLIHVGELFKHLLTVNNNDYRLLYSKLDDVNTAKARTAYIAYGDYTTKNNKPFSTFRKITVSEKAKLDIEMQFRQFDFNEELNYPFNIPKNYKAN